MPLRRLSFALLVVVGLAAPVATRGEVRQKPGGSPGGPTLVVQPVASGPWGPAGRLDGGELNHAGDLFGDGFPASATSDAELFVAWIRPMLGTVAVARSVERTWSSIREWPSPDAIGRPLVFGLHGHAVVVWGTGEPECAINVVTSAQATPEPVTIGSGWVTDGVLVGDTLHLLVVESDGGLALQSIVFAIALPDEPIPILLRGRVTLMPASAALPLADGCVPKQAVETMTPRVLSVEGPSDAAGHFAYWWSSPSSLSHVELDDVGPVLPIQTIVHPGKSAYSQSLIQKLRRELSSGQR